MIMIVIIELRVYNKEWLYKGNNKFCIIAYVSTAPFLPLVLLLVAFGKKAPNSISVWVTPTIPLGSLQLSIRPASWI